MSDMFFLVVGIILAGIGLLLIMAKVMTYQISGELAADEFGKDVFEMDAVSGEATFSPMPGV